MSDRDRFLELLLQAQPTLRSFIFSMVRDMNETEDISQEVALDLWKCFDRYDVSRPFVGWAIGVARNHVLRWRKKIGTSRLVFVPELESELAADFERLEPDLSARRRALEQCLGGLGDEAQHLVALRYEECLSLREIAEREHRTLNAVNKALGKIRALLLQCTQKAAQ